MSHLLLHTPEGVRDLYHAEFERKEHMEHHMKQVMQTYGFHQLMTPTFEYFDIFNKERGTVASRDMYKFVDRDGETLVLRPDMTPQAARCFAKYFKQETLPVRLFYHGSVFVNYSEYQGKLKESTQIGAELYNDPSVSADAEMVALMTDCLKAAGLEKFQIVIGAADYFRALTEEAALSEEEICSLREQIEKKNRFGVEKLLEEKQIEPLLRESFLKISNHLGSIASISELKVNTKNEKAVAALQRLEELYQELCLYGKEGRISFDLGMLSQFDYYTGVMFRAYTHGTGEAVAAGGRYDRLVGQFGKDTAAIGIALYADQIMTALHRQGRVEELPANATLILYRQTAKDKALGLAKQFRADNMEVVVMATGEEMSEKWMEYGKRIGAGGILFLENPTQVQVWNLEDGTCQVTVM